ncbi:MAG: hypothetical protein A2428_13410 [Bdellovibrionales bacterium RIFOXYC1_FULL_54_43]|nr:MAG: hypothetical protein A2428_13410 [Bdellovibrionales bacterium RIFOXYC1_FULL_54_43]OFZ81963.1 MAG: hypothetical protein A2603_05095 [Bdellovibrionales bacterium RIFOXYD1_FULL_55_31]
MNITTRWVLGTLVVGICTTSISCMSARNHPALDAAQNALKIAPCVEAYIEYPGPQEKWAGPAGFILHVVAREGTAVQVTATPAWFNTPIKGMGEIDAPTTLGRAPASAIAMLKPLERIAPPPAPAGLSIETARGQLQLLSEAIQSETEHKFSGCLNPVRARLIRADGSLIEKTGCRSDLGWPRVASESVHYFMTASLFGPDSVN